VKVEYINHMGDDLQIVNAAKVSFGKRSEWDYEEVVTEEGYRRVTDTRTLSKKDQGLIQFLARGCTSGDWDALVRDVSQNGHNIIAGDVPDIDRQYLEDLLNYIRKMPSHWSPFAHTAITLHLKMPIFVARQIMKHTTGIEYNEVSRRYVDSEPEFYVPDVWRKKADNVKQGSSDEASLWNHGMGTGYREEEYEVMDAVKSLYKHMLEVGVAPEQARMVLPQSMYTEVIATGNLYAFANMYIQRSDSHAQKETQDLAKQIGEIIQPLYPVSWAALVS
jgi:thymidylate synthase (FAD)